MILVATVIVLLVKLESCESLREVVRLSIFGKWKACGFVFCVCLCGTLPLLNLVRS